MRMPIYEYKCQKCGIIEITQRITDKSLGKCPTCKGKVKKLISHTSFQLKGTGWYVTDYARKGKDGGAVKGENGSKSSSEAQSGMKEEPKKNSKTKSKSGRRKEQY